MDERYTVRERTRQREAIAASLDDPAFAADRLLAGVLDDIFSMEAFARSRGIAIPASVQTRLPVLLERLQALESGDRLVDQLDVEADLDVEAVPE